MANPEPTHTEHKQYQRFTIDQRIEHFLFLFSFTVLGFTGLIQKYHGSPISQTFLALLGGIEMTRIIHRSNAV